MEEAGRAPGVSNGREAGDVCVFPLWLPSEVQSSSYQIGQLGLEDVLSVLPASAASRDGKGHLKCLPSKLKKGNQVTVEDYLMTDE